MLRAAILALATVSLAACAAGPGPRDRYGRYLQPVANPSKVVATELAFARAAQEEGQWTAFRKFAAEGALIYGLNGAVEAEPFLRSLEDPPRAVAWQPHLVWSSCDGSLAVTKGGYREPEGETGSFSTVWQRQRDGEYRYLFDFGYPDVNAPEAVEMIETEVADCQEVAASGSPQTDIPLRFSRDRSLAWGFRTVGENERLYGVWLVRDGEWVRVMNLTLGSDEAR